MVNSVGRIRASGNNGAFGYRFHTFLHCPFCCPLDIISSRVAVCGLLLFLAGTIFRDQDNFILWKGTVCIKGPPPREEWSKLAAALGF